MTTIHRLLDEAFADIPLTPDTQDLKEELRGNLVARAAELESQGVKPDAAAQRAMHELGDVHALVADLPEVPEWQRNRVKPTPGFVVVTTILSVLAAAGLLEFVFGLVHLLSVPVGTLVGALALVALPLGFVTSDALRHETSVHYAMPARRALGFGIATALVLLAVGGAFLLVLGWITPLWGIAPALAFLVGIGLLAFLGATQTNRLKPWALRQGQKHVGEDRFSQDPMAAARFGIYTVVIMVAAVAVFVILGFAWTWAWAWVALVAGFLVFFLVLAQMLFGARHYTSGASSVRKDGDR